MIVLMYGVLKFSHLMTKHNPNISSFLSDRHELEDVAINLNERKFRFAITVESFFDPLVQKRDPRYVKYMFRKVGRRNGIPTEEILPYHECTDADYAEFYPV